MPNSKDAGMLVIVDAVTSLAGIELKADAWGADVIYSGTQKCLSGLPGISPITFSDAAVETIRARTQKVAKLVSGYESHHGLLGRGCEALLPSHGAG